MLNNCKNSGVILKKTNLLVNEKRNLIFKAETDNLNDNYNNNSASKSRVRNFLIPDEINGKNLNNNLHYIRANANPQMSLLSPINGIMNTESVSMNLSIQENFTSTSGYTISKFCLELLTNEKSKIKEDKLYTNKQNNSNLEEKLTLEIYNYKLENKFLRSQFEKIKEKNEQLKKQIKSSMIPSNVSDYELKSSLTPSILSDYELLYKEKCDDLEKIENKFESISDKFNFIIEQMKTYQHSLIKDSQRLTETISFILQSFTDKQYDNISSLIQYIKENETFMSKGQFINSIANFLSNTQANTSNNESITYENKKENFNNTNDIISNLIDVNQRELDKKFKTNLTSTDSNMMYKELNFSDIKFRNSDPPPIIKKNLISKKISQKELKISSTNISYTEISKRSSSGQNSSINSPIKDKQLKEYMNIDNSLLSIDSPIKENRYRESINSTKDIILHDSILSPIKNPKYRDSINTNMNNIPQSSKQSPLIKKRRNEFNSDNIESSTIYIKKELKDLMNNKINEFC